MRSKEVAELTGVTVRALRHYHQIGLLPEPPRSENGYRSYRAVDVATVMRIRLLETAGFSLAQIAETFKQERHAGSAQQLPELLDEIDAELSRRIGQLEAQRATIHMLREHGGDVDALVPSGEHVARMREAGAGDRLAAVERDSLLLARLSKNPQDFDAVACLFDMLAADGLTERYVDLGEELLNLPANADDTTRNRLAHATVDLLAPYIARLSSAVGATAPEAGLSDTPAHQALDLLEDYGAQVFSPAQHDVAERIIALLTEVLRKAQADIPREAS